MSFSYSRPDGSSAGSPPPYQPPPPSPKKRRRWLWFGCLPVLAVGVVLLVVALALLADQRDSGVDRPNGTALPPNPPTTQVPGSTAVTASCAVTQGLITRECAIITPPSVPDGTKLPVVFLLHGFGDGPSAVRDAGNWTDAVIEHQFMLVTPSGVANSWNAGECCGIAKGTQIDDTAYLATLVDEIAKRPDVDPDRIFMAGFSNGGMMTYRFLCVTDRIKAAASVSGTRVASCPSKRPIPMLHIHGTGDETVPYQGGSGVVASILGVSFQPVPTLLDKVAAEDGCPPAPTETTSGTLTTKEWDGCRDGARVKFITIANWPHQWPLSGALDATAEVLSFFGIN